MPNNTFTAAASTTWTALTVKGKNVIVEGWGAGGGGGNNNGTRPGGGGGGGAYARNKVAIIAGNLYPYVVGQGGNFTSNLDGNAGTASSFNNNSAGNTAQMMKADFGIGGTHAGTTAAGGLVANCIPAAAPSLAGGAGSANVTTGTGGGGGGAAGSLTLGGASTASQTGGTSGNGNGAGNFQAGQAPTGRGSGGNGGLTTAAGLNGVAPGGGGGGSGNAGTTKVAGNGANGQVIISWYSNAYQPMWSYDGLGGSMISGDML